MTSVDSNFKFLCGRPHGAWLSFPPSTCVHLSLTPSPPCGRHKFMALTLRRCYINLRWINEPWDLKSVPSAPSCRHSSSSSSHLFLFKHFICIIWLLQTWTTLNCLNWLFGNCCLFGSVCCVISDEDLPLSHIKTLHLAYLTQAAPILAGWSEYWSGL